MNKTHLANALSAAAINSEDHLDLLIGGTLSGGASATCSSGRSNTVPPTRCRPQRPAPSRPGSLSATLQPITSNEGIFHQK